MLISTYKSLGVITQKINVDENNSAFFYCAGAEMFNDK
jgi:hypothetical protein